MRHVALTCKNHPDLRWSTKEIAFSPEANEGQGGYNGMRNIFFNGVVVYNEDGSPRMYMDGSGLDCDFVAAECQCSARDLIRAPEDHLIAERYGA